MSRARHCSVTSISTSIPFLGPQANTPKTPIPALSHKPCVHHHAGCGSGTHYAACGHDRRNRTVRKRQPASPPDVNALLAHHHPTKGHRIMACRWVA
jgi:hypothetical protein